MINGYAIQIDLTEEIHGMHISSKATKYDRLH